MNTDIEGLVAVVTGGASGIGAAVARQFTEMNVQVAVLDRDQAPEPDDQIFYVHADVTDADSVNSAVEEVKERFGQIDFLVNNAGKGAQGTIETNPEEEWIDVFDTNVLGIVRVTRACLPLLRESKVPAIVNISSIAATVGIRNRALYGMSKGAVSALTLHMAADLLGEGIRVNAVNPGTTNTPWVQRLLALSDDPEQELQALSARQPHKRLVEADEVAEAVRYLCSPRAGSTTGTSIAVDGGMDSLRI